MIVFLGVADAAETQQPSGILDNITTAYQSTLHDWKPKMQSAAKSLLISLGIINIIWRAAQLLFRGNNIADLIWEVVRTITVIGFFLWLIGDPKFGEDKTPLFQSLFDSMDELASKLTGYPVTGPSDCVDAGYNAFVKILDATPELQTDGFFDTIVNAIIWALYKLIALVVGILTMLLWLFTAVQVVIVTVSFSFLLYGGLLLLGLAGTEWTRNSALSYLNAVVAASLRYFGTLAVATLSYQVMIKLTAISLKQGGMDKDFEDQMTAFFDYMIAVLTCGVITYLLISKLPDMLANLVSPAGSGMGVSASQGIAAAKLASAATGLTAAGATLMTAAKALPGMAAKGAGGMAGGIAGAVAGAATGNGVLAGMKAGASMGANLRDTVAGSSAYKSLANTKIGRLLGSLGTAVGAFGRATGHAEGQFKSDFLKMGMDEQTASKAARDANKLLQSGSSGGYYAARRSIAGSNGIRGDRYDQFLSEEASAKASRGRAGAGAAGANGVEGSSGTGSGSACGGSTQIGNEGTSPKADGGSPAAQANPGAGAEAMGRSGDTFNPSPQNVFQDHEDPFTDIPGRDPIGSNLNESWDQRPGNINN